jgi:hypothetical protein
MLPAPFEEKKGLGEDNPKVMESKISAKEAKDVETASA